MTYIPLLVILESLEAMMSQYWQHTYPVPKSWAVIPLSHNRGSRTGALGEMVDFRTGTGNTQGESGTSLSLFF